MQAKLLDDKSILVKVAPDDARYADMLRKLQGGAGTDEQEADGDDTHEDIQPIADPEETSERGEEPSESADEDTKDLAEFYANHWNHMAAAGMEPNEESLWDAEDELEDGEWSVYLDEDDGTWKVAHISTFDVPRVRHDRSGQPLRYAWVDHGHSATGKKRWKNSETGRIAYQEKKPGDKSGRSKVLRDGPGEPRPEGALSAKDKKAAEKSLEALKKASKGGAKAKLGKMASELRTAAQTIPASKVRDRKRIEKQIKMVEHQLELLGGAKATEVVAPVAVAAASTQSDAVDTAKLAARASLLAEAALIVGKSVKAMVKYSDEQLHAIIDANTTTDATGTNISFATSHGKDRKEINSKSLREIVKTSGGISLSSLEACGFDVKAMRESGLGGLFRRNGGRDVIELAAELHNEGHIVIPGVVYHDGIGSKTGSKTFPQEAPQYLLDQLEQKVKTLHADASREFASDEAAYNKEKEDAERDRIERGEIEAATNAGQKDGDFQAEKGDAWEGDGSMASQGDGIGEVEPDPWDVPEPAVQATSAPTIDPTHIKEARKQLAAGKIGVKGNATSEPVTSALSGLPIRRHIELASGAKVHPDELHRAVVNHEGKVELHPLESISVKDPMNSGETEEKSFGKALLAVVAYKGNDGDRVTLQSPHGYTVTKTRGEWRAVVSNANENDSFATWFDRENPEVESEAAKAAVPRVVAEKEGDTDSFFAQKGEQGRLYHAMTPDLKPDTGERPGLVEVPRGMKGTLIGKLDIGSGKSVAITSLADGVGDIATVKEALRQLEADGMVTVDGEEATIVRRGKPSNPPGASTTPVEPEQADPVTTSTGTQAEVPDISPDVDPREIADQAKKSLDADYEFARASDIPNMGEDLKGSARHKVNAWKSLQDAENDGTAEEMVTRENLLKNEPPELLSKVTAANSLASLAAHFCLNSFPAMPYDEKAADSYEKSRSRLRPEMQHTMQTREGLRKQYYEAYQQVKSEVEKASQEEVDPRKVLSRVHDLSDKLIRSIRGQSSNSTIGFASSADRYNPVANALCDLHKRTTPRHYPTQKLGANTVESRVNDFTQRLQKAYGSEPTIDMLEKAAEHVKDIMEGDSFNKTFGTVEGGKKGFDPSEMYVKHAVRKGGREVNADTVKAGSEFVLNNLKMRGLQWGNSVTDDEREHHLQKSSEAFADLADVVGLPDHAMSLQGVLGLAIGARGKGTASAHYEPGTKVINLTRKNGVGTLAHEWGHALDHHLTGGGTSLQGGDYMSNNIARERFRKNPDGSYALNERGKMQTEDFGTDPIWSGMDSVRKALKDTGFDRRLKSNLRIAVEQGVISKPKANNYWDSNHEKFARTFERYVQHKLRQSGRDNTYLAGLSDNDKYGLWPNDEEIAKIAPAIDSLLMAVRAKHFTDVPVSVLSPDIRTIADEPDRYARDARDAREFVAGRQSYTELIRYQRRMRAEATSASGE